MKPRILFSYVSIGSGHQQATKAIEKHIKKIDPEAVTLCVNSFSFSGFVVTHIVSFIYLYTIKYMPGLWGYLYDNLKVKKKINVFHSVINWGNSIRFHSLIKKFKPSVIVCTQAIPCGIVASLKKRGKIDVPLVAVVTDFAAHIYWIYKEVDLYFVATEDAKSKLVKYGVDERKIKVSGIPIDGCFIDQSDKKEILKKEKLSDKIKTILLMGGSRGIGKLREIITELDKIDTPHQIIAVAGSNKRLKRKLDKLKVNNGNHLKVYGYAEHLNEIMDISDLIVTKPGGLTSSEVLVKGLPMVVVNPIPGQEEWNSRYLIENGAAVRVNNIKELGGTVKMLFNNPERLEKMRQSAIKLAKPAATRDIGGIILELGDKYGNRKVYSE